MEKPLSLFNNLGSYERFKRMVPGISGISGISESPEIYNALLTNETLQLMAVLPPCSYKLVDDQFQKVFTNIQNGCIHMYPSHFRIHTFLKTYLWECCPVLPAIDICQLNDAMNANAANASF